MNRISGFFLFGVSVFFCVLGTAHGGTATSVNGLYYTGSTDAGGLQAGGTQDTHWDVTYASVPGNGDSAYRGSAYVVSSNYIDGGWTQNTSTAQWIVPPGASTAATGGTLNVGGDYLPGNGNSGNNEGIFVYTLAFTILGTGSGTVTNAISISLTLSADDQYAVYVNPTGNGTTLPTGTAAASATSAWNSTAVVTLQNGTNGNSIFKIGTNYLTIVVDNTNSVTGSSSSQALNPSGLMLYQTANSILIDGHVVPEVGAWLPVLGAVGLFCWRRFRTAKPLSVA